jgi:predicted nucleic acid-binding protein
VIVADTGGLLSALFPDQRHHAACARVVAAADRPLVLSPFVLAELDYLILELAGVTPELALLDEVARGAYLLADFGPGDVAEAAGIVERYRDLEIGLADASNVVLARRFATLDLLTLDERDFRTIPGLGGNPFRILPADL